MAEQAAAAGIMVVEAASVTVVHRHFLAVEELARLSLKLGGQDLERARTVVQQMRAGLLSDFVHLANRDWRHAPSKEMAERLKVVLDEEADARIQRATVSALPVTARHVRPDPIAMLLNTGGITSTDAEAAQIVRDAVCWSAGIGWEGLGAIDPTRIRVSGGKGWDELTRIGAAAHPKMAMVAAWLAELGASAPVGSGERALTLADVCRAVIIDQQSTRSLDRQLGVRNGAVVGRLRGALGLFNQMRGLQQAA